MDSIFLLARNTVRDDINRVITEERLRALSEDLSTQTIGENRLAAITNFINVAKTNTAIIEISSAREIEEAKTLLMPTRLTEKLITDRLVELFLSLSTSNFVQLATDISNAISTTAVGSVNHVKAEVLSANPWLVYAILTKYIDLNPKVKESE